jgi:hypothetical protein
VVLNATNHSRRDVMSKPATSENQTIARSGSRDSGVLLRVLCAATLAAVIGLAPTGLAAAVDSQFWSVAVHIEYPDGFVYEHAFAVGVPTADLPSILAECGRGHRYGSAVRYHCFPIPE